MGAGSLEVCFESLMEPKGKEKEVKAEMMRLKRLSKEELKEGIGE